MYTEDLQKVANCIRQNPIENAEILLNDIVGGNRWRIIAKPEEIVKAVQVFTQTERTFISDVRADVSKRMYIMNVPMTLGVIRAGVYTYNAAKNTLE